VADAVFESAEFRNDLVQGFYGRFLHRASDSAGQTVFTDALVRGVREQDVLAAIVGSAEYFNQSQSR
jgi:hypothetical protein